MKRKVLPVGYRWLDRIPRLPPAAVRALERLLATVERAIPVHQPIVGFLRREAPDVMLVSPLVDCGSDQVDIIKAARACGVRTAVCVASWDNLTNKGVLRIEPDLVVVWNERRSVRRRNTTTFRPTRSRPPALSCSTNGSARRSREIAPPSARASDCPTRGRFCYSPDRPASFQNRAQRWRSSSDGLRRCDRAGIRCSAINVLVRPHPYNCHAWDPDPLADIPGAVFFPRTGYDPMDEANRADFFDSIHHSTAVVGINTSAMIEAAIIGRPVFSLLAEEFAGTQEGLVHFHYLASGERRLRPDCVGDRRPRPAIERTSARSGGSTCRDAAVHFPIHSTAWARSAGNANLRRQH